MDATIHTVEANLDAVSDAAAMLDLTTGQQRALRVLTYQMNAALTELSDLLDAGSSDPAARNALDRALSAASELTHLASDAVRRDP